MNTTQQGVEMKLIDEWRKAYKFLSVQANTIGAAMASTYALMYPQLKDTIPAQYMAGLTALVFVAGIVCRVVSQDKKDGR